jgi:nucleoside 2-deoxyribosyltransferase
MTIFDLGMAYALGKRLVLINEVEPTQHKSFNNVIQEWANEHRTD